MTGQGIETYPDGSRYEGNFKDHQKDGQGKLYYPDGRFYSGNFVNDRIEGHGTMTCCDGTKVIGEFKAGKGIGTATEISKNGEEKQINWID